MTNTNQDAERQLKKKQLINFLRRRHMREEMVQEIISEIFDSSAWVFISKESWQARASQEPRPAGGELRERAKRFAEGLYALLSLGDHAKLPNAFIAVTAEQVAAFAASERGHWVSKNGFTLCREDGPKMYIGVVDFMLGWTPKPEDALYLSRREDADKLAEICEDAWTVESLPLPAPPAEKGEGR